MRFSIVIPCYNSSSTIIRALDSLSHQNFDNYEVIVVDDCSTDNTVEIINRYIADGHNNVKLLSNDINMGPGASRNKALDNVSGEYIAFIDSDDYVSENYFEKLNYAIDENKADLIYIGCQLVIGNEKRLSARINAKSKADYMALSSGSLCMIVSSTKIWHGIKLPSIKSAEDIAVIPLLYYRANNIINIPDPLYNYIYNGESISSKPKISTVQNFIDSFEYTRSLIPAEDVKDSIEFHGIKTIIYGAILNSIKVGLTRKDILYILKDFETKYPNWIKNKYVQQYPLRKRIFLNLASHKCISLLRIYVLLHTAYLKYHG